MPEDPRPAAQAGSWSAPIEQLRLALHRPVLATLTDVGAVGVSGADAAPFLNSQLTVDVTVIDAMRWQLGAYCSVKGRVIALFEILRVEDGFLLLLPAERAEPLRAALTRYVLRSKVRLRDAGGEWVAFGLTGPGIEAALEAAGLQCPKEPWTCQLLDGARLARLPASPRSGARLTLLVPAPAAASWRQKLADVALVEAGVWWWSKIDAGLPDVVGATQERFVPQMLNLDVLGGVHFRKGCYPGQEVVARSQYLGKLRRRMARGHAAAASAGDDVLGASGNGAPVGSVVMSAASPDGGVDLLLECPSELAQVGTLRVGGERSGPLNLSEPPYPMINPTA
jgi:folate-binding protein YgfZ